jgi:hypothetical protein
MKAGVVYPQIELGGDTGMVKAFPVWLGGRHLSVETMRASLTTVDGHMDAIRRRRDVYNTVRRKTVLYRQPIRFARANHA